MHNKSRAAKCSQVPGYFLQLQLSKKEPELFPGGLPLNRLTAMFLHGSIEEMLSMFPQPWAGCIFYLFFFLGRAEPKVPWSSTVTAVLCAVLSAVLSRRLMVRRALSPRSASVGPATMG